VGAFGTTRVGEDVMVGVEGTGDDVIVGIGAIVETLAGPAEQPAIMAIIKINEYRCFMISPH